VSELKIQRLATHEEINQNIVDDRTRQIFKCQYGKKIDHASV